ncbi:hypothetical protein WR25_06613 isoform C [Diploscapter pachys]|uniref:Uncharacterized protein n=1 Tax=Diploscapter pachys TaxID=2018661 RepID=A0A2A2L1C0_9BILA|nr:hypothetical protein WR25_06613 isoform B [Diploscapter pachys]PAV79898.1 hypothetical protein WR25_06613 isoform C [Diploscapter pachys]
MTNFMSDALQALRTSPAISIALVRGNCLGGSTELSSACDIRVAHRKSKFGFWQGNLGLVPVWGGASYLVQTVGRSNALMLMATTATLSCEEAHRIGYVNRIFDTDDEAKEIINSLLKNGVQIAQNQKMMINALHRGREGETGDFLKLFFDTYFQVQMW